VALLRHLLLLLRASAPPLSLRAAYMITQSSSAQKIMKCKVLIH
jgi:hypothetical protein